jgi:ElaB/YqjD/DUF883 family membrane-anchored ribosome-binding protein
MSNTPICDAINNQFDQWDKQIEELKNKTKEAAKEQAEKIKKDIQEYVEAKSKELTDQKTSSENKQNALAIPSVPTSPDKAVEACAGIITCLEELVKMISSVVVDSGAAPVVLTQRSTQTINKLTQI